MTPEPFFCSDLSRARPERLYGTAPAVDTWILLEYPGAWGPRAIADSSLPTSVKAWISDLPSRHRVLLIRRNHTPSPRLHCFVVHSREHGSAAWQLQIERYDDLLTLDLAFPPEHYRIDTPFFLVCTHGRKDKCCSRFGMPVYRELQARIGGNVWQCSHVGGDRFAANILWFPYGLYYGHVYSNGIGELLDACFARRIHLDNFRGRTCYDRPVQAGEYFIRDRFRVLDVDQLTLVAADMLNPTDWRIRFSSIASVFTAELRCVAVAYREYLTCAATETRPVPQYELLSYSRTPIQSATL